jgi:hypothetical protein
VDVEADTVDGLGATETQLDVLELDERLPGGQVDGGRVSAWESVRIVTVQVPVVGSGGGRWLRTASACGACSA